MRRRRLLTATAFVWLALPAARAAADLLPSRPISFGDGRVVVSGDVALSFGSKDAGYFNLFDYSHDAFNVLSMSLTAEIRATDRLGFVGQVFDEVSLRGRDPDPADRHVFYPYAFYARVRPTAAPFTILAGRIPPVFGAFARRDYGEVNALIGLPLAYGYSTTMRPEPPPSRRELVLNRGGGWAVRYPARHGHHRPARPAAGGGAALGHRRVDSMERHPVKPASRHHGTLSSPRTKTKRVWIFRGERS